MWAPEEYQLVAARPDTLWTVVPVLVSCGRYQTHSHQTHSHVLLFVSASTGPITAASVVCRPSHVSPCSMHTPIQL